MWISFSPSFKTKVLPRDCGFQPASIALWTSASMVFAEILGRCGTCGDPFPVTFLGNGYSRISFRWRSSSERTEMHTPFRPSSVDHWGSLSSDQLKLIPSIAIRPCKVRLRRFFWPCITLVTGSGTSLAEVRLMELRGAFAASCASGLFREVRVPALLDWLCVSLRLRADLGLFTAPGAALRAALVAARLGVCRNPGLLRRPLPSLGFTSLWSGLCLEAWRSFRYGRRLSGFFRLRRSGRRGRGFRWEGGWWSRSGTGRVGAG